MSKRKWWIVLGLVFLLCGIWTVYKIILLRTYESYISINLDNIKEVSIKTDKSLANTEIYGLNLNIPDKYKEKETESNQKFYVEDDESIAIWVLKTDSFSKSFTDDKFGLDYAKLTKKYDIKDEVELFYYAKNNINSKPNIFWNKSRIQMNYVANSLVQSIIAYGTAEDFCKLTGDLNGIKSTGDTFIQINLFINQNTYIIRLNKNKFTDDDVNKLLSSIHL